jgi:signal transduction histidine kinase
MVHFSACWSLVWVGLVVSLSVRAQPPGLSVLQHQLSRATTDTARSRLLLALSFQYVGDRPKADSSLYFARQSLAASQRGNDSFGQARALCQLAHICVYVLKDEGQGLEWVRRAIAVARPANDHLHLAHSYKLYSVIADHQRIGNAHDLIGTALLHAQMANDWRTLSDMYAFQSTLYLQQKKYTEAQQALEQALRTCGPTHADTWLTLGLDYCRLLERTGKPAEARAFANRLASVKPALQHANGEFNHTINLARLATMQGNYSEAETILLRSLTTEQQRTQPDTFLLYHYHKSLVALYEKQGNYQKAYLRSNDLTEALLWLQRTRQTRDSKLRMTELQAALAVEKKEREVAQLAAERHQQRLLLMAAGLVTALLGTLAVLLQRSRQRTQRQRAKLSQLNAAKDKLLALLAHDLRSPVANLTNYLMLINWGALSKNEFAESAQSLGERLTYVHTLLDNLLQWALTQLGGFRPSLRAVAAATLVQEQLQGLQPTGMAKGVQLTNQIPPDVLVEADPTHLSIILRNLLHNALKFTSIGGSVTVGHRTEHQQHVLLIQDTGIGISPERLAGLFSLGSQPSRPGTAREPGAGLGLTLVHELVVANGGSISVTSTEGQGTCVTLRFKSGTLVGT